MFYVLAHIYSLCNAAVQKTRGVNTMPTRSTRPRTPATRPAGEATAHARAHAAANGRKSPADGHRRSENAASPHWPRPPATKIRLAILVCSCCPALALAPRAPHRWPPPCVKHTGATPPSTATALATRARASSDPHLEGHLHANGHFSCLWQALPAARAREPQSQPVPMPQPPPPRARIRRACRSRSPHRSLSALLYASHELDIGQSPPKRPRCT